MNAKNLVMQSVIGSIAQPRILLKTPYLVDPDGNAHVMPGTGGITYNVAIGDPALGFIGDHVEPGVSITCDESVKDPARQGGLSILACIGNEARVVSGRVAGSKGIVTGKHGGVEHIMINFAPSVIEKLTIGDRIQIKAYGQGLRLRDAPDVSVMNIDPGLLRKMGIVHQNKQLVVPVSFVIPSSIMGSGIGSCHSFSGDYDIQIADREIVNKYGLQDLRLGDVIAIMDADCRYGRSRRTGACTIGIVVHASCITSGHGPGVTVIMTTEKKVIVPKIDQEANLAKYLDVGRFRKAARAGRRRP